MPHEQQRLLPSVSLHPDDEIGTTRLAGKYLDRDAFLLEDRFQIVGGKFFIAGRVAGIESEQRLEMLQRFGLNDTPVRLASCLRKGGRAGNHKQKHNERPTATHIASFRI